MRWLCVRPMTASDRRAVERRLSPDAGRPRITPKITRCGRRRRGIRRARARPVHRAGLAFRRGPHTGLDERRVAGAHPADRRDPFLQPQPSGALAQGRHLGQHHGGARHPLRLRRRRPAGAGGARRARPATRASAPAFIAASSSRRRPERSWARSSARSTIGPARRPQGSYTVTLLDDPALAGAKVQEEAEEVVRAAREESDERVAEEGADVLYHLAVLLRGRNLSLADAERVLDGRRQR